MALRVIIIILSILGLQACATQSGVSGGPQDKEPPKVLLSSPVNYSTNFKGGKLMVEFDEYVVVKKFTEELLISPPIAQDVEYDILRKTVAITLPPIDSLQPNTTYSIYLGDAIQDLNEGNILDSNLWVFSTGDQLDSLSCTGVVKDAYTNEPIERAYVMMYSDLSDSIASKTLASYLTRTDKEGRFYFNYLAEGDYNLYALNDKNRSRTFDQPSEDFAFLQEPITLSVDDSLIHELRTYKESLTKQFLSTRSVEHYGMVKIGFNLDVDTFSIRSLMDMGDSAVMMYEQIEPDSFHVWLNHVSSDSLWWEIRGDDFVDSLLVDFQNEKKHNERAAESSKVDSLKLKLNNNISGNRLNFFDSLSLTSNYPIDSVDWSRGMLVIDEDTLGLQSLGWRALSSEVNREISTRFEWTQGSKVAVVLAPGCVTDVFGLTHDSIRWSFNVSTIEDYGSLTLHLDVHDSSALILELLDKDGSTLHSYPTQSGETIKFPPLDPGEYGFKLIIDRNNDGLWTTGHYGSKRQPEPVFYFEDEVQVRANWELDLTWSIVD